MQGTPTSRKSGSNAPYRPINFECARGAGLSLEFLLKQAGFRVRTASNGEAALAAIAQEPPDLVLLDVMIPGRYGVCQEIRSNPGWRDMRIIMLTAKGGDIQREKGLSLGADEYVTKPFSTRELVDALISELSTLSWFVFARPEVAGRTRLTLRG